MVNKNHLSFKTVLIAFALTSSCSANAYEGLGATAVDVMQLLNEDTAEALRIEREGRAQPNPEPTRMDAAGIGYDEGTAEVVSPPVVVKGIYGVGNTLGTLFTLKGTQYQLRQGDVALDGVRVTAITPPCIAVQDSDRSIKRACIESSR